MAEEPKQEAPRKEEPKKQEEAKGQAPAGAAAAFKEIEGEEAAAKPARRSRSRGGKNVPVGIAYIKATFNNTQVTLTDMKGAVISWSSGGRCGFKGSRKSTAFAATTVAQDAARTAISHGMQEVEVRVQGPGAGRESAIRALQSSGLHINAIKDVTPIPHNGCRPPKRRRV